ncbi:carbohydrate ABC transporter membrane protein 1, CUT1 family [Orenia metallireducens]|jgi:putative aldouronate transport system permease protein|uniref:Carbohydrate ABC transporter membrane protein 1, CUT1 family n=1 Tax=Orenia metallireducens TaxID=1413210 RepID=A0A285FX88_9FIRM|nr:sugar ABC transporter permease [Orenia metallireducens]SNY15703.1 carbohydrate ABC transporter membrane protein 1, CUT1 family [Orenia metallireducens]
MNALPKLKTDDLKANTSTLLKKIIKYKYFYLMLLPGLLYLFIFKYIPMYGIQLAFKKFMFNKGITGSPWVGLENFRYIFSEAEFWNAVKNTVIIAFMKIGLGFWISVVLAILISELRAPRFKKKLQVVYTFPHFLSWVIVSGIVINLLSNSGAINNLLSILGFERISPLTDKGIFRYLLVYSEVWKEAGWGTILYLAAITGIDPTLYEAATIDGASRWDKIKYITWPSIKGLVVVMLLLSIGQMMNAGFMQIFNMYNPTVYDVADIIDTYVYRITFERAPDFGVSTAVGMFKGVTNLILLLTADKVAKKMGHSGII